MDVDCLIQAANPRCPNFLFQVKHLAVQPWNVMLFDIAELTELNIRLVNLKMEINYGLTQLKQSAIQAAVQGAGIPDSGCAGVAAYLTDNNTYQRVTQHMTMMNWHLPTAATTIHIALQVMPRCMLYAWL